MDELTLEMLMERAKIEGVTWEEFEKQLDSFSFDFISTTNVIHRALRGTLDDAATVSRALVEGNVRGAVRAEVIEENESRTRITLEIVSEDNRVYQVDMRNDYRVEHILDVELNKWVYSITFNHAPPIENPNQPDPETLNFDFENTMQVIYDAIGHEARGMELYSAGFFIERRIKGIIHAEVVENTRIYFPSDRFERVEIHLKIETEDNKHYLLVISSATNYELLGIIDLETDEIVR